jgi:hypothetical protein
MSKKHLKLTALIIGIFALGFFVRHLISFVVAQEGTIRGCVGKQMGVLRIIDTNEKCLKNESLLTWNIQGPPGPSGSLSYPFVCVGCVREIGNRLANRNLSGAYIQYAAFFGNDLSNSNFTDASLIENTMNDCNFTNSNLTNADTSHSNFKGSNFTNATVTGVKWFNTTCPDGTNSDNNGNTCEEHLTP